MNRILILLFLTFSLSSFSQNQAELNKIANLEYSKADKDLNNIYQHILTEYKTDKIFVENLKKSQRIWIEFRDAELEMKYPKRESGYYGSVHPMCIAFYLKELTERRTKNLKVWKSGIEEGDVCIGSVKMK
tara:strand:+ start:836 stop:1228 length:393 start_codon:yes stop_codon:yes gene_type:complete